MRHRTRAPLFAALAAAAAFALARPALALGFDALGDASFDPLAVVVEGFEGSSPWPAGVTPRDAGDALEGKRYVVVQTPAGSGATLPLRLLEGDHAYRARMFARTNRVVAQVAITNPADGGFPSFEAIFFPTGRVTSDGWYEVATAPFTFEASRGGSAALSIVASGADVDALEIVEEGSPRATKTCSVAGDAACGAGEFCSAGFCHDGAVSVPPLPDAAHAADVAAYLGERIDQFFGGRASRAAHLAASLATIGSLRDAKDPWTFWNGFVTALHQLHDWHTTVTAPFAIDGRGALPVCFVEGDADISRALAPSDPVLADVLVSHVGPEGASGLKPGDRLVAVNGVHPIAFAESLDAIDWDAWHADDPAVHAEAIERMRVVIRRWAKTLTFIRCDAAKGTCAPPVTTSIADLPAAEPAIYPSCDHRPLYHLASDFPDPVTHDVEGVYEDVLAGTDGEALYGMIWNDEALDGGGNPFDGPFASLRAGARGVILDHRTGNGGTEYGAEVLTSLFRAKATFAAMTGFDLTLRIFDAPFTVADGLSLFQLHDHPPDTYDVGSEGARTDLKTALLLARDGSASDWFPYGVSGAPNVRLFGRRTAGAFSSFLQFDYYAGFAWRLASGDLVRQDGTTHLGEGVVPDEEIVPRQSDLVAGKDTVYERALAWLRAK